MTAQPTASPVTDWRGTPITEGALVIYGAGVGRSIQLVEGEVEGFTKSGRVNVRVIRRSYLQGVKDVVDVGPDRLTVVTALPPRGFSPRPLLAPEDNGVEFGVHEETVYTGSQGDSWTIPAGFRTDFATIPAAVSWAIPKLGAYTLAAIVHDLLCTGLNDWWEAWHGGGVYGLYEDGSLYLAYQGRDIPAPTANATDTDAIFYKIARDLGTDPITATLLWVGVRWGALANPARREGWLSTAPRVLTMSVLFAPVLVPATVLAVVGRGVLAVARRLFRRPT